MRNDRVLRATLRGIAIVIAILGLVDPPITTNRASKPIVSVVGDDSARVEAVARGLEKRFVAIRGAMPVADASVIVGGDIPATEIARELARPVFAVLDDTIAARAPVVAMSVPKWAPSSARIPVRVTVAAKNARGRRIDVSVAVGNAVAAHATRTVATEDERIPVSLGFVPTTVGANVVRVAVSLSGRRDSSTADAVVDVKDARWSVLFYDARPSWMSTFVRRALEQDARFTTRSRVTTSRGVSTQTGKPPARLDDPASLSDYDAIVVGAPDALDARAVAGLDAYLRRRGGGVLLLLDHASSGPYETLARVTRWSADSGKAVAITSETDSIRAAEYTWPAAGGGVDPIATARSGDTIRPVIWRSNVGAGELVVSGALDAWRFRDRGASDRSVSSFDRFWRETVAGVAGNSPPPIDVSVSPRVLRPGARAIVHVTMRDAALSSANRVSTSARAALTGGRTDAAVRLLPTTGVGEMIGELTAPATPGIYHLAASSRNARVESPIVVSSNVSPVTGDHEDLVAAFATARGGRVLRAGGASIADMIAGAIRPAARPVTWHPMRSAWWILPFALALCAEWWLRRRQMLR